METSYITGRRIKEYLSLGKRFDERKLNEFRNITIEGNVSNKAEGSCRVKIGKTEVIVGVKLAVGTPYPDSADKGNLMTTAEILPLSSDRIELGKPGFDSIELGRVIDRALRESGFIDFKKLCIEEGKKVWTVFVDIYSINDDGNLLDAAGIGAVVALKNSKLPKYDLENEKVLYDEESNEKVPLTDALPLTVSVHKVGDSFIVDPTREEEDLSETRVTIGSSRGIISSIQKSLGQSLSSEEFSEVLDLSQKAWDEIESKIKKYLK
jgi:exosome complex component RRP42